MCLVNNLHLFKIRFQYILMINNYKNSRNSETTEEKNTEL